MIKALQNVGKMVFGSFDQNALLCGISDILVVQWDSGFLASTPFLACFGPHATLAPSRPIKVTVNGMRVNKVGFTVDKLGYLQPMRPTQQILKRLPLVHGRNQIQFELEGEHSLSAELYLYGEHDRLLVSDVDGTMTKNDIGGLIHNMKNADYLHDGYCELIQKVADNGYKIVWLTMRSMPLYSFSKKYIQAFTKTHGVLLTEPEEFFPAIKKEVLKQTGNIKANMMRELRRLFPVSREPFVAGLGNRQNDAIAYLAGGIRREQIFIIDTESEVHNLADNHQHLTYEAMHTKVHHYFPRHLPKSPTVEPEKQPERILKKRKAKGLKQICILIEEDSEDGIRTATTCEDTLDATSKAGGKGPFFQIKLSKIYSQ